MNNYGVQYKALLKQQWQSMDWVSKSLAALVFFVLLLSGMFTGLFIFSASVIIASALYLKSKFTNSGYQTK